MIRMCVACCRTLRPSGQNAGSGAIEGSDMSDHPLRQERIELEERRIIKAFALQKTTAITMPSQAREDMALLSLLSWGGESTDCALRYPVLKDLRAAIDDLLQSVDVI